MIKIAKLITGESLIGWIDNTDNDPFTISNPMSICSYNTEDGIGMALRNAVSLAEEDYLVISKRNVLTFYTPTIILKEYYNEILDSIDEDGDFTNEQIRDALAAERQRKLKRRVLEKRAEMQVKEWLRSSNTYH